MSSLRQAQITFFELACKKSPASGTNGVTIRK